MEERPAKRPRAARDVADPGPSSSRPPEAAHANAERSGVPVEVEGGAAEPFQLNQLPPELLVCVLEAAGARAAWRLRRVCRAWKAAAEGVEWRPFELDVRSAEAAAAVANTARGGRLAVRGEMDVRVAITEQLAFEDPRLAELLAALASAPAGRTCGWSLRDVDASVRLEERSLGLADIVLGVVFGLLRALQPAVGTSPILSLAFQCTVRWPRNKLKYTDAPHEYAMREAGRADERTISDLLSRFPRLERLFLPASYPVSPAAEAAVATSLGPQLRWLRLRCPHGFARVDWLLRFPLLESLEEAVLLVHEEDALRIAQGLPNLRRVRFDASHSAALRGLASALPQARALRDLELHSSAEDEPALAAAVAAASGVLRECWLMLLPAPASPALLRALGACRRLERLRLIAPFGSLQELGAYRELAALPRLSGGLQVGVCRVPPELHGASRAALEAALAPCRHAGTELQVDVG